ncbi:MAG: GNAT family N-acetyltransferase [Actinomycetota bacterium]|nr:GNAT family N-acetyltransferase [Actinomycetota bacterium]
MRRTARATASLAATSAANQLAEATAARAGVRIVDLHDLSELTPAIELFDLIWAGAGVSYMPIGVLRALEHADNHVSGAFDGDRMVGALVGFMGFHREQLALHSHMLAVLPKMQGRSIGSELKLNQRSWAIRRGVEVVTWTFDPLISRNAYLNVTGLGVEAAEYHVNFYGEMTDSINAGDESDRLLAVWRVSGPRAEMALSGRRVDEASVLRREGLVTALAMGSNQEPAQQEYGTEATLLCRIPTDIESMRRLAPDRARAWRLAVRDVLGEALAGGYAIEAFLRRGCYVVSRRE